jgi:DNA-directed RNA polymerase specialized sigma24 family protein
MEDTQLMAALRTGDESAWDEAFRRLYPCAFYAARHPSVQLTDSEAEDVAIEALTTLVPKVRDIATFAELRALTVTMATRAAISLKRRLTAQKRGSGQVDSLEFLREEKGDAAEPHQARATLGPRDLLELAELLKSALAQIDDPTSSALIRDFLLNGHSYNELAAKHDMPLGTVGVKIARGLKKIRSSLEEKPRLLKELQAFLRA